MKVISYICDICGNPFNETDLHKVVLAGNAAEIDTTCKKALDSLLKDTVKWNKERNDFAAAEAVRLAAEAEEVKP